MPKPTLAGAAALLAAPIAVIAGVALMPTVSDDGAAQVTALSEHRDGMIAGLTLQTIAISLLIGGAIWLAHSLAGRAPRLALAGGILAVGGSLIPLFEDGVSAAAPALTATLDPAQAAAAFDHIRSGAITAIEPLSLVGDLGLALLGVAALKAGAPRWAAVFVALGAFGEGVGFGSETKPLVLIAFAVLFVGFAAVARTLLPRTRERLATEAVPA
jgi:hypothetical protein